MRLIIAVILFFTSHLGYSQDLYLPKVSDQDEVIHHNYYSLAYSEQFEQALWVAYELTSEETIKNYDRTGYTFKLDNEVKSQSANNDDYLYSGYDRGHLAPARDMSWKEEALRESFLYSNCSPQNGSFNGGIWKKLESQIRQWAIDFDTIQIATGPIILEGYETIGDNKVAVPQLYYKVVIAKHEGEYIGIGIVQKSVNSKEKLESFAVTIDMVEEITGIDFFHNLDDNTEIRVESSLDKSLWSWTTTNRSNSGESKSTNTSTAVQCNGITQKGARCKNRTKNEGGYCYHHDSQGKSKSTPTKSYNSSSTSVQCSGTTKAGNRCKRMTKDSSGRCYQH